MYDSGWNYIQHRFIKLILLLVIWSWKCNNMLKNKITILQTLVIQVYWTTLNISPHWISKLPIRKHKNHCKVSIGAERFAQNLRVYKKSRYNVRNQYRKTQFTSLSGVVIHNTNLPRPTFHIMLWRLREGRTEKLKLYLLVDRIECFVLLILVKILLFVGLQECNCLFYLLTNQTYIMINYSWIQNKMIVSVI